MQKIIYILPERNLNTHFKYNIFFVEELQKDKNLNLLFIIEKEKYHNYFIRVIKLFFLLLFARLKGYKKVYIHYSFLAVYISKILFLKIYYWNCGIPWQYKRNYFQEFYESFSYKLINHFVTGAEVLAKKYSTFYKFDNKKSIIIPNWINVKETQKILEKFNNLKFKEELNFKKEEIILFFNQRLSPRKGVHYILPILQKTNQNVKMIISNDGPYKEKLLEEIKKNDLENRVKILGKINHEKVLEILNITDIYILPSEEEGMSHSLMEAFVSKVPTIAFDVGATADIYPDNFKNYVIAEKNIDEFIKKLIFLIENKEERKKLAEAEFEKIKEYDLEIVLKQFKEKIIN